MCVASHLGQLCAAGNYHDVWLDSEHESEFDECDEDEDVAPELAQQISRGMSRRPVVSLVAPSCR